MRFVLLVSLLLIALPVTAQNSGVLLPTVPHAENKAAIVNAIKLGFEKREWTVVASDETSVTGVLKHNQIDARMRVWLENGKLLYEEKSIKTQLGGHIPNAAGRVQSPIKLDNWLENLREDIGQLVALTPSPASTSDAASRLKILEELRAQKLITEDEYSKKRAEILGAL